jgi:alpha-1,6-mannosyltransferase
MISWAPLSQRRAAQAALIVTSVSYLIACPYSKVEESFNVQATYDLFTYGLSPALSASFGSLHQGVALPYDHLQYPGVVPRTFFGPLILSSVCQALRFLFYPVVDLAMYPLSVQCLARLTLLILTLLQWFGVASALDERTKNTQTGTYLLFITASQFHLPFYASRLLPNSFASVLTLRCYTHWLRGGDWDIMAAAVDLVLATALFRCDCLLLLLTVGLSWLFTRQVTILRAIQYGIAAGVVALVISVLLDSLLWQRFTWPEGEVLFYNTVLNKSSDWGVSVWHWYWSSALPKALLGSLLFIPLAVIRLPELWTIWERRLLSRRSGPDLSASGGLRWIDTAWLQFLLPALSFVTLYSFLGHKEVRFLFPALPLFNIVSAAGMTRLHLSAYPAKSDKTVAFLSRLGYGGAVLLLMLSWLASTVFVATSFYNYPGGDALQLLSRHVQTSTPRLESVSVHIDVASAMSGVSLFGQSAARARTPHVHWAFEKAGYEEEHAVGDGVDWTKYTHLLTETDTLAQSESSDFIVVGVAQGNPRLDIPRGRITTSDAIYILERKGRRNDNI